MSSTLLKLRRKKRIIFAFAIICIFIIVLSVRLAYIQSYKSMEYADKQTKMLLQRLPITASRGDIYDRNMNLLAKDATSQSIYVRPVDIKKGQAEEVAEFLSKKLDLKYKDVYKKITSNSSLVLIKRKVDNSVALDIEEKNYSGVELSEDKKRYYTNGSFACHILGFTGTDHQGLYGIEAVYDDVLKGVDGVTVFESDGNGKKIESGSSIRQEPESGSNLVLTIDSVLQNYLESALESGIKRAKAKTAMGIAINPNTGEVLAMASYPEYDLNDPWTLSEEFVTQYKKSYSKKTTLEEKQYDMWENPLVSYIYEPGSTFKVITVSSALEEGIVDESSRFTCRGSTTINGTRIRCHIYPSSHGTQSVSQILENSCNPAMVEIAMRMGPDIFYRYIYNYGFGFKTGVSLNGEESGIVSPNQDVNTIDFVTMGFGQGIAVTPIQMVYACSSAINGGYLLKPQIVKYVTSGENNEITKEYKKETVRQVISEETSSKMRKYLRNVVTKSNNLKKYSKGIEMGGKTGTAQKIINGRYAKGLYVTSFFGFAPYDDPEIAVLIILDEPLYATSGSTAAAPVAGEFLKNAMNYLENTSGKAQKDKVSVDTKVVVPDVRGYTLTDAESILSALEITYEVEYLGEKNEIGVVVEQSDIASTYKKGKKIKLVIGEDSASNAVIVPDVSGMTVQSANQTLKNAGLEFEADGGGVAVKQSVKAKSKVKKGTKVRVTFKYIE